VERFQKQRKKAGVIDEVAVDEAEQLSKLEKTEENDSVYYPKEPAMAWEGVLRESRAAL